jgi:hypothetical protein
MLWVVLVTMVVTILRFTTPTTAVVCLGGFYPGVVLYLCNSTVLLIVLVTASMVVPILWLTAYHSYYCHGFTLY